MKKAIIGKKLGMTQIFDNNGNVIPVTVIEAGPCLVTFKKTAENDGYEAVQLGYGEIKASKVTKPMKGHFDKNDVAPKRVLKEFLTSATLLRPTPSQRVRPLTLPVAARVRATPALSSATALAA